MCRDRFEQQHFHHPTGGPTKMKSSRYDPSVVDYEQVFWVQKLTYVCYLTMQRFDSPLIY
jgi:hypothetical protein